MNPLAKINVGVVGTGFMGVAHTEALRRVGVNVCGIVGSTYSLWTEATSSKRVVQ